MLDTPAFLAFEPFAILWPLLRPTKLQPSRVPQGPFLLCHALCCSLFSTVDGGVGGARVQSRVLRGATRPHGMGTKGLPTLLRHRDFHRSSGHHHWLGAWRFFLPALSAHTT